MPDGPPGRADMGGVLSYMLPSQMTSTDYAGPVVILGWVMILQVAIPIWLTFKPKRTQGIRHALLCWTPVRFPESLQGNSGGPFNFQLLLLLELGILHIPVPVLVAAVAGAIRSALRAGAGASLLAGLRVHVLADFLNLV